MFEIPVWQMINQVTRDVTDKISYKEIAELINQKWNAVKPKTIRAGIIMLTVNHKSRVHYNENQKPRTSNSHYDLLFSTARGEVVKYNSSVHGIWEIANDINRTLIVRKFKDHKEEKIYTPSDIRWVKNITNEEMGQAYMNPEDGEFVLNFPTKHRGNILSPDINDIILLRQKINGKSVFTHLVTPSDNEEVDENLRPKYRYGRNVKTIAKIHLPQLLPVADTLWRRVKFSGISNGNVCRLENVKSIGNVDELQYDIWSRFSTHFTSHQKKSESITAGIISEITVTNPELKMTEGGLKLVNHITKERSPKIIKAKKDEAIAKGTLYCEVCLFSFQSIYDASYIECHHLDPIAGGIRDTYLTDLAIVCSNCHRMLHTRFDGQYLNLTELKKRMDNLRLANA